jgi:aspartyl-tRNA(Asn)/glutamyl-tRNA(Gln) amidotransferase subunit B
VNQAIRLGLGLKGRVNPLSYFERKHYFYCDLPQGYQITQQSAPIVTGGSVILDDLLSGGQKRTVRINRLQLEQDSGKSVHNMTPGRTHVDLNRAGVALIEIVGEPDIR